MTQQVFFLTNWFIAVQWEKVVTSQLPCIKVASPNILMNKANRSILE